MRQVESNFEEGSALGRAADFGITVTVLEHVREEVPNQVEVIYADAERVLYGDEAAAEKAVADRIPPE